MEIYIVRAKDSIESIASQFHTTVEKLIQDNGLINPHHLVIGQSIVVTYPKETYTVKEGDSIIKIAEDFQIPFFQILRNNPFLFERERIYVGDTIVLRYDTHGTISTNGFAHPFIELATLRKTLPYLTYLSIFNYSATEDGGVVEHQDESQLIQMAKEFGVAPLLSVSTLSLQGQPNVKIAYELLEKEEVQEKHLNNLLTHLKAKEYYGINLSFQYLEQGTQELYQRLLLKLGTGIKNEGYRVFVTIDPKLYLEGEEVFFNQVDYDILIKEADGVTFIDYTWATSLKAPSPISSNKMMDVFLQYVTKLIPEEKIIIGTPIMGYDWKLPFVPGFTRGNSLSYNDVIMLAVSVDAVIQFDSVSQTPFYEYTWNGTKYILWFIDARSIQALLDLVRKYNLDGTGIWNIMIHNAQLWSIMNSQFELVKVQTVPI